MGHRGIVYILFLAWTVTNAQFFYNYEQENPETEETELYNPSEYKYNPPSAVEHHFLRSSQVSPARTERSKPRSYDAQSVEVPAERPRIRQPALTRRQRPQPVEVVEEYEASVRQQPPEYASDIPAEPISAPVPARQSRRRQSRPRPAPVVEVVEPPKYYGPSVFDNIPLGQPPAGVYVPHDSLLNLIRDISRPQISRPRSVAVEQYAPEVNMIDTPAPSPIHSVAVYRPEPYFVTPPPELQRKSYVQPVVSYVPQPPPQPITSAPIQPEQHEEEAPQPRHIPSSQEIRQNEYRRQRRVQRPQTAPQPRPRPQRRSRQQSRPVPQPSVDQYQEPPQPISNADTSVDFPDDIRRSPRRTQTPVQQVQQTRRQQVAPVAATAPTERKRQQSFKPANLAIATLPDDDDEDGIPGVAGVDYPTLHVIPSTSFSCSSQPHSGYYADLETSCQVVHLCQAGGVKDSFLCPNGTIFSQEKFSCQWWYKVNCQNSPRFYSINDRLYKVPEDKKKRNNKERS